MINAVVIGLLALAFTPPETQKLADGFYMTVKCSLSSKVVRQNRLNHADRVCLVSQPFLPPSEIKSVSDMVETTDFMYFDIILKQRATELINALNSNVANEGVALVIDDEVLFRINTPRNSSIDNVLRIIIEPTVQNPHQIRKKIADIVGSNP